jgi:hypothetical protein
VRQGNVRKAFGALLVGLLVQFLSGLATNLWVVVPGRHPGAGTADYFHGLAEGVPWALARSAWLLRLHALRGLLLLAGSLALVVGAWLVRRVRIHAVVGWLFTQAAAFNGGSFVNYRHDVSSFIMGACWAFAAATYVLGYAALASLALPPTTAAAPVASEDRSG